MAFGVLAGADDDAFAGLGEREESFGDIEHLAVTDGAHGGRFASHTERFAGSQKSCALATPGNSPSNTSIIITTRLIITLLS